MYGGKYRNSQPPGHLNSGGDSSHDVSDVSGPPCLLGVWVSLGRDVFSVFNSFDDIANMTDRRCQLSSIPHRFYLLTPLVEGAAWSTYFGCTGTAG
jgi:hypothetical protein